MPAPLHPDQLEALARKRAGAKMGWYTHLCVYLVVNAALFAASHLGLRQHPWSLYSALVWGVALLLHAFSVFVLGKGSSLRERLVDRERERLQREQQDRRW